MKSSAPDFDNIIEADDYLFLEINCSRVTHNNNDNIFNIFNIVSVSEWTRDEEQCSIRQ